MLKWSLILTVWINGEYADSISVGEFPAYAVCRSEGKSFQLAIMERARVSAQIWALDYPNDPPRSAVVVSYECIKLPSEAYCSERACDDDEWKNSTTSDFVADRLK